MSVRVRCGGPLLMLVVSIGLGACALMERGKPGIGPQSASPLSSAPVFVRDAGEVKLHQALVREQDAKLTACGKDASCAPIHFIRALLALYESRVGAADHFQDVMTAAPNTHLASSSRAWLRLLKEPPENVEPESPLAQAAERLVREFLELEASSQALERDATARDRKAQELTKQLEALKQIDQERDKKVQELTKQLEALKQIDQEMNEKARATLPSHKAKPPVEKDAHP